MPKKHGTDRTTAARRQLARNLRASMADAGLGNADLARRLGVSPSTVGDWVSGRSAPSIENLVLVASIVRQSVSWLCGDALHGLDTLEHHQQDLAVRLGGERLRALSRVPDEALLAQIDLLLRSHPPTEETVSESAAKRKARKKSA